MITDILVRLVGFMGPISISITQIAYGLIFLIFIYEWRKGAYAGTGVSPYWKYMLALAVMVLITSLLGDDPARSFKKYKQVLLPLTFFVGYYMCKRKRFDGVIFWTLAGGALASIAGVVRFMLNYGPDDRIAGFFASPVRFGNIMAFIAVLGFCVLIFKLYSDKKYRIYYVIFTALSLTGLLASTTLGAIAAFAVGISVLFIIRYGNKGIAGILGAIGIIALAVFLIPLLNVKISNALFRWYDPTTSFGWRLVLWKESWRVFLENPLTGVGLNNIKPYFETFAVKHQSIAHSHSNYFQTLVDHGILGVIVIGALYLKLFIDQIKGALKTNPFAITGMCMTIVLIVAGFSESCLFDSEICMLFWLLSGALLTAQETLQSFLDKNNLKLKRSSY